jgi:ribosomal protein S18 acetylase RimI-like enzyme
MNLEIVKYEAQWQPYFEKFNKAWIEEYFTVEPIDKLVLENPEEYIIKKGGSILFAKYGDQIIGTVAIIPEEPGVYELTKMAVDKNHRGLGAGKLLCAAAVAEVKNLGADKVILYSQTLLTTALAIYRSLGFVDIPIENCKYKRSDVMMELVFN